MNVTLSEAKEIVKYSLSGGIVPLLISKPGIGKSSIIRQLAEEAKLQFIDVRLASMQPEDLNGFPVVIDNKASYVNFTNTFPTENTPLPKDKNGWLILLDELPSASQSVKVAAYKLLLDRELGNNEKLHSKVMIVAAGNGMDHGAIASELGTALVNRVLMVNISYSEKEFIDYLNKTVKANAFIVSFLQKNGKLGYGDQENEDEAFATPRSWEFLNNIMNSNQFNKQVASGTKFYKSKTFEAICSGLLGQTVANAFIEHVLVFSNLPNISNIFTSSVDLSKLNPVGLSFVIENVSVQVLEYIADYQNGNLSEANLNSYVDCLLKNLINTTAEDTIKKQIVSLVTQTNPKLMDLPVIDKFIS